MAVSAGKNRGGDGEESPVLLSPYVPRGDEVALAAARAALNPLILCRGGEHVRQTRYYDALNSGKRAKGHMPVDAITTAA